MNNRTVTTAAGVVIGGGLGLAVAKLAKADTGMLILFTIVGISAGAMIGYSR